ncbi:hypothetical protein ACOME3_004818 [Neoechinorhynchus agilis]
MASLAGLAALVAIYRLKADDLCQMLIRIVYTKVPFSMKPKYVGIIILAEIFGLACGISSLSMRSASADFTSNETIGSYSVKQLNDICQLKVKSSSHGIVCLVLSFSYNAGIFLGFLLAKEFDMRAMKTNFHEMKGQPESIKGSVRMDTKF